MCDTTLHNSPPVLREPSTKSLPSLINWVTCLYRPYVWQSTATCNQIPCCDWCLAYPGGWISQPINLHDIRVAGFLSQSTLTLQNFAKSRVNSPTNIIASNSRGWSSFSTTQQTSPSQYGHLEFDRLLFYNDCDMQQNHPSANNTLLWITVGNSSQYHERRFTLDMHKFRLRRATKTERGPTRARAPLLHIFRPAGGKVRCATKRVIKRFSAGYGNRGRNRIKR